VEEVIMSEPIKPPAVRGCVAVAIHEGEDLQATVGIHFGRAPRFLLVRTDPEETVRVLENVHVGAAQGAGPATASLLIRQGVTAVLAGQFGPKAEDALRAGGILPITVVPGTTAETALMGLQAEMLQGI
jgi:predicted Fe-Mo cluster-binding NifX family protein